MIRQIKSGSSTTCSGNLSSFKNTRKMLPSFSLIVFLVVIASLNLVEGDGHGGEHAHVIIHVPYHIKKIKHTHTITKHIHHGGGGGNKYEVLGYTVGHPIDLGGHGGFGGHRGHGGFGGHGGFEDHGFQDEGNDLGHGGHAFYGGGMESFGGHEEMSEGH